jgi:DnaJ-class molecular chaperone
MSGKSKNLLKRCIKCNGKGYTGNKEVCKQCGGEGRLLMNA